MKSHLRACSVLCFFLLHAVSQPADPANLIPQVRVSADLLRGHASFLASDALQGRYTASPGADTAAEYIASQFRAFGLEAAAPDYMQAVHDWVIEFKASNGQVIAIQRDQVLGGLTKHSIAFDRLAAFLTVEEAGKLKPNRRQIPFVVSSEPIAPPDGVITIQSPELATLAQKGPVRVTLIPPGLKNVIGVLRGRTDEVLIVSAHYDHLGAGSGSEGEIYNGANDDASGVAVLLETARVLASAKYRLRRTLVFAAFSGEEEGMVGSRYYAQHPLFPIAKTAAQLNLEQLGRTDDSEGPRVKTVNLTGYSFTDIPRILQAAAAGSVVHLQNPGKQSDDYFGASDNEALARMGVPTTTLSVAYEFPDYHKPGDDWQKIDYKNMATVAEFVVRSTRVLASRQTAPRWNENNSKVKAYAELRRATRPGESRAASGPVSGSSPANPRQSPPKQSPKQLSDSAPH